MAFSKMSSSAPKRPRTEIIVLSSDSENDQSDGPRKSAKKAETSIEKRRESVDYDQNGGIFLMKLAGQKRSEAFSLDIRQLFRRPASNLTRMLQMNFMVDLEWFLKQLPSETMRNQLPIDFVHGLGPELKSARKNIRLFPAQVPSWGTHHTKAMVLVFDDDTIQLVIHTANLIAGDWGLKTQGMWLSPRLKKKSQNSTSSCIFERDFLRYLNHYGFLQEWVIKLKDYDFSSISVMLVASVPGRHQGPNKDWWGHMKLRQILREKIPVENLRENDHLIAQSSSLGSFGPNNSWLINEFFRSLNSNQEFASDLQAFRNCHVVYPTVDDVRNSLEGYDAGGSLPFDHRTLEKQPYLYKYLNQWKAQWNFRTLCMPHIKSYLRVSPLSHDAAWFCLTSANLSKAAWGTLEKKQTQLSIRNYEMGIVICSEQNKMLHLRQFHADDQHTIPVPYDLPLSRYSKSDECWTWTKPHLQPDGYGNCWPGQ